MFFLTTVFIVAFITFFILWVRYMNDPEQRMYSHLVHVLQHGEEIWGDNYRSDISIKYNRREYKFMVGHLIVSVYVDDEEIKISYPTCKKLRELIRGHRYDCLKQKEVIQEKHRKKRLRQQYDKIFPDYGCW